MSWQVIEADCVEAMREMDEASVDAVVTDPPAGISFMGRAWDSDRSGGFVEWLSGVMREALRITKPGGHALVWALPRTSHWTGSAIESAGWEIRDRITHHFGSGFPKSLAVDKAIDRARNDDLSPVRGFLHEARDGAGMSIAQVADHFQVDSRMVHKWMGEREDPQAHCPTLAQWVELKSLLSLPDDMDAEVWRLNGRKGKPGENWEKRVKVGTDSRTANESWLGTQDGEKSTWGIGEWDVTVPATPEAQRWQGWGTALKPATEDWWLARKPLVGTVAQNVERFGTGALNIDGCRVGLDGRQEHWDRYEPSAKIGFRGGEGEREGGAYNDAGRWPANVVLSHLPECERVGKRRVKGNPPPRFKDADTLYDHAHGDRWEWLQCPKCSSETPKIRWKFDPPCDHPFHDQKRGRSGLETVAAYNCAPGCPVAELDRQSGELKSGSRAAGDYGRLGYQGWDEGPMPAIDGSTGHASRFFYVAKSSRSERTAGVGVNAHPT